MKGPGGIQTCDHCDDPHIVERVDSRAGRVRLCLSCSLLWFPGKSVAWWEARHTGFIDHVEARLKWAREREEARNIAALQGAFG